MRLAVASALVLLGACSPTAPDPSANDIVAPPPAAAVAAVAPAGTAMRAEVSPLSGQITDLRVRITDVATIVDLPADVLFAFDEATLTPAADAPLRKTVDLIGKGAPGDVRVIGHTDAKGDDAYNLDLSKRRAASVVAWLAANGVAADRLKPEGRGEAEPIAANTKPDGSDDPDARARNRRVEVAIPR